MIPFQNEIIFLLVYAIQIAYIVYCVNTKNTEFLIKLILTNLILNLIFTSRIIVVFGAEVNIGVLFLLSVQFMCYILYHMIGVKQFLIKINQILFTVVFMFTMMQCLLFLPSISIEAITIDHFIEKRTPYFLIVFGCFYIAQVIHALSYKLYKNDDNFLFDFTLRIFIIMQLQSAIFYTLSHYLIFNNVNTWALYMNGMLVRGTMLLILLTPVYWYLEKKCKTIYRMS